jgi:hypothetical protein
MQHEAILLGLNLLAHTPSCKTWEDLAELQGWNADFLQYAEQFRKLSNNFDDFRMQRLWLDNNRITDLTPLQGLVGLQDLWLRNNRITDLAPLRKKLHNCSIYA